MIRYYDKELKCEVAEAGDNTLPSTDERVAWWFSPIEATEKIAYDTDGLPYKYNDNFLEPIVIDGLVVENATTETLTNKAKAARFRRLEQIFNDKTTGLKKLAIDKPFMMGAEAINNQYRVYEEMYKNALAGRYDDSTNTAIITANEAAKTQLADLTLLLNSVRAVIENAINTNAENVDILLDAADSITLTLSELTPTKIGEIMTTFGL